jgi:hypothetical protein
MRLRNPESQQVKEMAKWEMYPSEWTIGSSPGNPYIKGNTHGKPGSEYPKMLYVARPIPGNGKPATSMEQPSQFQFRNDLDWERECRAAKSFGESCQKVVNSEDEELKARGQGYRPTHDEAVALFHASQRQDGNEAAERAYRDRNMSEKAKAEVAKVEADTFGHVPSIPEKPVPAKAKKVLSQAQKDAMAAGRKAAAEKKAQAQA